MNPLREALLRGRRRPRNAGSGSPTHFRGDGYEFVELREYVPGDDVRRIDWAATARSGSLQSRVILEDVALTLAAILDSSPSMRSGRVRPLTESAAQALAAWYGAASSDDRCVRLGSGDVVAPPGLRGTRSAQACAAAVAAPSFSLIGALDTADAVLPRGTALLAISDFYELEESDDLLLATLGRRFDCTALVARDPWYDGLPLAGFVRIADAETRARRAFYIGPRERHRYATAVREREMDLFSRLERADWRTGLFDETDGADALLRAFGVR